MNFQVQRLVRWPVLLGCLLAITGLAADTTSTAAPQLHASGRELVNASGSQVILHGVDRSGTEYLCVQGTGIFAGPSDQASISARKSWSVDAVRIPLNEACWNGESYVNPPTPERTTG
jgi:hypothetical protein